MQTITEGKATIKVTQPKKISKEMPVFYNPVMKLNRDISIVLLSVIDKSNLIMADPLAGTGIRSIRFLKELKSSKIKSISINDYSKESIKSIKKNLSLNKLKKNKINISNDDANLFLLNSKGFDYIDIDPFGTPVPYLDSAVRRIARDGILAVTATDTGCLCGTFPKACIRKYWAMPKKSPIMHETGLRILIRKIQLIGVQYNKALTPIFSYSKEHYFRVFLKCGKGKEKADEIMKQQGHFNNIGPMWLGSLWDSKLVKKMCEQSELMDHSLLKMLKVIDKESKISTIGFYDIHKLCKKYKLKIPKMEKLLKYGSRTIFNEYGIKTELTEKELVNIIKK